MVSIILCGGSGSRLWPLSRETHPKPFIHLQDGQSLLQKAYLRAAHIPGVNEIITVTRADLIFKIKDEYSLLATSQVRNTYILEPFSRNTAAAIVMAALKTTASHGPQTKMLVLAADHLISNEDIFANVCMEAGILAQKNQLITFGIKPQIPHTGYGYIEACGNKVVRFVEKPTLKEAEEYLASGRFYWNAGIFCFQAGVLLDEFATHSPALLSACKKCLTHSQMHDSNLYLDAGTFAMVPDDSIDYALLEKSQNIAVIPCNIGWRDIGCWNGLGNMIKEDKEGNRIKGTVQLHDVKNCIIQSQRMIGAVGIDNLLVIDTPDALLIADRRRTQEIKQLYAGLKERGHSSHKVHTTSILAWGSTKVIEDNSEIKINRLMIKPGKSLPPNLHCAYNRNWIVVSGKAKIMHHQKTFLLKSNDSFLLDPKQQYYLENPGTSNLVILEIQSTPSPVEKKIVHLPSNSERTLSEANAIHIKNTHPLS